MEMLLTPLLLTPIVLMVTASVVGLVMLTPEGLLRADVVGLLTVTGKPLGWVAAGADIVMVSALESVAVMVVPAGMPGPVMICPTTSPETLDTDVTTLLLKVRTPVGVTTGVEVAGKDMVTVDVVAPTTVILAPVAMPVPVTACPTIRPLTLETFAMMLLPLVTMPVKEKLPDNVVVVAVAGAEIVTVLPATATMVVLAGMPAPVMVCPGSSPRTPAPPVTADTNVMRVLPRVVVPVNAKMLLAVAFAVIVMVKLEEPFGPPVAVPPVVRTVAVPRMPVPLTVWPFATPLRLDTDVMMGLPLVTMPVGATVLEAEAAADIVMVLAAGFTEITIVCAGMLVPVMGCPGTTPATLDTVLRVVLPLTATAVGVRLGRTLTAVMTAPDGIPIPDMASPTRLVRGNGGVAGNTAERVLLPRTVPTWKLMSDPVP
jgi:hypothetical protein